MSKKVKLIRALFLLIVCAMMVFAIRDTHEIRRDTDFDQENILHHIENLTANGPRSVFDMEENRLAVQYITDTLDAWGLTNADTLQAPAYQIQSFVGTDSRYQNFYLDNVIVHIPANADQTTGEAVMFMSHTDSVPMGDGASDDGVPVSVMMEAIRYYLDRMEQGFTMRNDLVFCFVNGEEVGLQGSAAFMNEFEGFDNVVERIRFATNLESRGTEGTLVMFETSENNYHTVKMFADVNETVFTSSIATMIYSMMPNGTDFSNLKEDYQGLNMANIGGGQNYHTQNDTLENVGMSYLSQQAQMVDDLIEKLANCDLDTLGDAQKSAIFFSYLNLGTVMYDYTVAMILALALALLMCANVLINRKHHHMKQTAKASAVVLLALAASGALTWVCYDVFQKAAALLGSIDPHMVGTVTYSNHLLIVGIGLMALSASMPLIGIAMRFLKVTSRDLNRSFGYINALLGIGLTVLVPDASYLFVFSGLMLMINEVAVSLKPSWKKYRFEMLINAVYVPVIMPILTLAVTALGLTNAPIFGVIFSVAIFPVAVYGAPRCGRISLGRLFGRKGEPQGGFVTVMLLCSLVCLAVCDQRPNASVNLQGKQNVISLPKDDAVVYVDNGLQTEYRIYDLNAYYYLKAYAPAMTYNGECYSVPGHAVVSHRIQSKASRNVLKVITTDPDSLVYLTFSNIQAETFTVDDGRSVQTYVFDGSESQTITLYDDCTVTVNGGSTRVFYREVIRDYPSLMPVSDAGNLHFNLWLETGFVLKK